MKICLNMIVKNEAPVIRRCLDSVRPYIDRWVIVDTGSTDGTQDIIRAHLADIPGELHERPWRDFAHNRTEALELARGTADYLLFIDADEVLRGPDAFAWPALAADAYFLHAEYAGTVYSRCALVSTRLAWRWVGVLHEYLTSTPEAQKGHLDWPRIVVSHDGARARDPDTYRKDAEVLEKALRDEPDNARYAFYLAQTWRDAGEPLKARAAYRRRAAMPGWDEETFEALYEIGRMSEALRAPIGEIQAAFLAAYQFRPRRAEPLYQLARFHRERGEFALAYLFARQAAAIPRPADLLFVDDAAYLWRSLDELSVAASYVDALDEGRAVIERLLAEGTCHSTSDRASKRISASSSAALCGGPVHHDAAGTLGALPVRSARHLRRPLHLPVGNVLSHLRKIPGRRSLVFRIERVDPQSVASPDSAQSHISEWLPQLPGVDSMACRAICASHSRDHDDRRQRDAFRHPPHCRHLFP